MRYFMWVFAFLLCLTTSAFAQGNQSTFDSVIQGGKIRCGYAMWTPVMYQNLETQKLEGVAYDLMEEIGKRLDLKIEWAEETGWGTIVEGLATKRYDMVCVGIGNTSGRAKVMDFSVPLFYSPLVVVARKDDTRFDKSTEILNDPQYKISLLDGELTSIVTRQVFPKITGVSLPQTADYSMLLKEVETSKADITMITADTFIEYDHANPGKLKAVGEPVSVFPISFGLPQKDLAFKRMIDITVNELIYDGTIDRILKKYEKYPGSFLRSSKPYVLE